ncbi:MAG: histidinol dehydrogenase [Butyricimonas faecihominis]
MFCVPGRVCGAGELLCPGAFDVVREGLSGLGAGKFGMRGSVFLGHYSPESGRDYVSGMNYTLPTNGYARAYKRGEHGRLYEKDNFPRDHAGRFLIILGRTIEIMADNEKLEAHGNAVKG